MIKRVNMREGYQRAAAGVMSCLLVGSALGLPLHQREPVAAVEGNHAVALNRFPPLPAAAVDGTSLTDDQAYLSVRSGARERFAAAGASQPKAYAYTINEGDSLWNIAETLGTDTATLVSLNPAIDPELVQPGQTLQVVDNFHGMAYTVEHGDTMEQITARYGVTLAEVEAANGLSAEETLAEGRTLFLPGARPRTRTLLASRGDSVRERTAAPDEASAPEPAAVKASAPGTWIWPITGGMVSSEFGGRWGGFHSGIDIAVPTGTRAVAARGGTVAFSGWDGGFGYCVIIDHGNGVKTRYAHASALLITTGETVEQGTPVIQVGTTGHSTGPHLHFEVIVDGTARNPRNFLP